MQSRAMRLESRNAKHWSHKPCLCNEMQIYGKYFSSVERMSFSIIEERLHRTCNYRVGINTLWITVVEEERQCS